MLKLTEQRLGPAVFLLCLLLNLGCAVVGWNHSIREIHESRQVQTALSAREMQREGLSLDYPLPIFGPPWSAPFEFPLYQGSVALFANATGMPLEPAGRLVALSYFHLALPALFLIQGLLGVPGPRRWLLPAALLVSPVYLYYSRTFMIESAAFCTACWFLFAFARAVTAPGYGWFVVASALGALSAAVKLTTFAVFLVPAALLTLIWLRRPPEGFSRVALTLKAGGLALVGLAGGILWTRHADAVKAGNPLAAPFLSTELREFVLGTTSDRLAVANWDRIFAHAETSVMPALNAALLVVFGLVVSGRRRGAVAGLLLAFLAGPLFFPRLYAIHDYYLYASGVFAVAALAVAWGVVLDLARLPRWLRLGIVGVSLALQFGTYAIRYLPAQQHARGPVELAQVLARVTEPGEVLLALGHDWNPTLAYEADRRAIMVVDRLFADPTAIPEVIRRVGPGRIHALVVGGHLRQHPAALDPLVSSLGLHPDPVFVGPDAKVYLARAAARRAEERVAGLALREYQLVTPDPETVAMPRQRFAADSLPDAKVVGMLHPRPREIIHPFGLAAHDLDGRTVTDAHAPTDFVFAAVAGATRAEIEFGIMPGAITAQFPTDGVLFRVEQVIGGQANRVLFARELHPGAVAADRGPQVATVTLPVDQNGDLIFRTLPGRGGSIASDWAYWARIDIR